MGRRRLLRWPAERRVGGGAKGAGRGLDGWFSIKPRARVCTPISEKFVPACLTDTAINKLSGCVRVCVCCARVQVEHISVIFASILEVCALSVRAAV